jgi:hypothetical protein
MTFSDFAISANDCGTYTVEMCGHLWEMSGNAHMANGVCIYIGPGKIERDNRTIGTGDLIPFGLMRKVLEFLQPIPEGGENAD